jgi:hypothetical protein
MGYSMGDCLTVSCIIFCYRVHPTYHLMILVKWFLPTNALIRRDVTVPKGSGDRRSSCSDRVEALQRD